MHVPLPMKAAQDDKFLLIGCKTMFYRLLCHEFYSVMVSLQRHITTAFYISMDSFIKLHFRSILVLLMYKEFTV